MPIVKVETAGTPSRRGSRGAVTEWHTPITIALRGDPSYKDVPAYARAEAVIDGREVQAEIELRWQPERCFKVSPSRIILQTLPGNTDPTIATAVVKRIDGAEFEVEAVNSNMESVSTSFDPSSDHRQATITIALTQPLMHGQRKAGVINITTNSEVEPQLRIPVIQLALPALSGQLKDR